MSAKHKFLSYRLRSWSQAQEIEAAFAGDDDAKWVFKGHADANWRLSSTIERTAERFRVPKGRRVGTLHGLIDVERRILTNFRRVAHLHYVDIQRKLFPAGKVPPSWDCSKPEQLDTSPIEWLALVQHHGGPTRLLDFTKSFWIAAFFALEAGSTGNVGGERCVWAVSRARLWDAARAALGWGEELSWGKLKMHKARLLGNLASRKCIALDDDWYPMENEKGNAEPEWAPQVVLPLEPERVNARLNAQQGVFLFPMQIKKCFLQNLVWTFDCNEERLSGCRDGLQTDFASVDSARKELEQAAVVKVFMPDRPKEGNTGFCEAQRKRARFRAVKEGLEMLERMGITQATLFPDLDGAARAQAINVVR